MSVDKYFLNITIYVIYIYFTIINDSKDLTKEVLINGNVHILLSYDLFF